jgi:glycosyltransferase involved in cell wall biosynthesis
MKSLFVRGPIMTLSGYGYHARQFAYWAQSLQKSGYFDKVVFEVLPWGITPWLLQSDDAYDADIIKYVIGNSSQGEKNGDVSIQIQLPNEWNPNLCKFNIGVTAGVETDRVNPDWIKACFAMDRIIVPSQFTKSAFLNSAENDYARKNLDRRITVINEAFHPSLLVGPQDPSEIHRMLSVLPEKNFLLFGQLTGTDASNDRKNTFNAIKWFVEEWGANPDVGLIIKTNSGKNTSIDRKITKTKLDACVKEAIKLTNSDCKPKVFLMHGAMTEHEKNSLYTSPKISALLMPTRGEGYGLPILEAALLGLPVIAPRHSGYLDFVDKALIEVDHKLVEIPDSRIDNQVFIKGAKWAEVCDKSCKAAMHKSLDLDTSCRVVSQKIANQFSIDETVKKLNIKFLKKDEMIR